MKLFLNHRCWFSPVAVILTCGVLGACAGDRVTSEDRELLVVGTEYAFDAPRQIESGVVTVHLVNEGITELHNAALMRLTGGHTLDDFSEWMRDSMISPPWAVHVGEAFDPTRCRSGSHSRARTRAALDRLLPR